MIPVRARTAHRNVPLVTYTILALNVLVFLWDRQGNPFGASVTFSDLTMRPHEVVLAIKGIDRFAWVTVFTSMFMHANIIHIAGNMIFLLVFGSSVEFALGPIRYTLYYLIWGVAAAFTQVAVDPSTMTPTLGASGAIGGILGCYLLLFPSSKIEIIVPILAFLDFEVSAWVLLGLWFLYQVFAPQDGVANWAHVGGFLAGMLTVLAMGGRAMVFRGRERELEAEM
ncbi:MAG: rhomboid family intramembrane serine protease [Fimbriimonadaceae bacterium]